MLRDVIPFKDPRKTRRKKPVEQRPTFTMLSMELLNTHQGAAASPPSSSEDSTDTDRDHQTLMNPSAVCDSCQQRIQYPQPLEIPYRLRQFGTDQQPDCFLWSFYVDKTTRFCAIHEFETPLPYFTWFPVLQNSLIRLSATHWTKTTGSASQESYDDLATTLMVKSIQGLRQQLEVQNLNPSTALVCIAACVVLAAAYIGEGRTTMGNVHLNRALNIGRNLTNNPAFKTNKDAFFSS